jgi:hypothetical protein
MEGRRHGLESAPPKMGQSVAGRGSDIGTIEIQVGRRPPMKAEGRWSGRTHAPSRAICLGWEHCSKQQGGNQQELKVSVEEQPGNNGSGAIPEGNAVDQRRETGHCLVNEDLATLREDKSGEGQDWTDNGARGRGKESNKI